MEQRDYSYDWLRAFAAIMIVCCHIFQGFGISQTLSYYCSGTFVCVFLVLSAFLLGQRHRETIGDAPWHFLQTRMKRLIPTYYSYLTISLLLMSIFVGYQYLSLKQIIGHYTFVNWFLPSTRIYESPLPQLGHLWFMSCIVMSYVFVALFATAFGNNRSSRFWWKFTTISMLAGIAHCSYFRFFVYPSVVITLFPLMFFQGNEIVSTVGKIGKSRIIFTLGAFNLMSLLAFYFGLYDHPSLLFVDIALNAVLWIVSAPYIFNRKYIPTVVAFISAISFEIYLVHHPFCLGYYNLNKYMPTWVAVIAVFALTIPLAYILNILGRRITTLMKHRIATPLRD